MKFTSYASYKDSGVEWLGEVPEHWDIKRLKFCAPENSKKVDPKNLNLKYIGMENIESWTGQYISTESAEAEGISNLFQEGNVLFGKLRPYLAKAHLTEFNGLCSSEFLVLNPKDITPSYLVRYVLTYEFINIVDSSTYGTKMPRANWDFIGNMPIIIPSIKEQTAIADFLDRETSRIDELSKEKERFIELLKEKRQALISHAVTKGLNPTVKMKNSGIAWLGEVPEHWKISKLKLETSKIVDGTHFTPTYVFDGVPFLRVTDIQTIDIKLDEVKRITEEEHKQLSKRCMPSKGDVLLSKNGTIGITKIVDWDWEFSIFVSLCLLKFKVGLNNRYFSFFFESDIVDQQISESSKQTSVINLHLDKIKELIISIPPIQEQTEIANYLDQQTQKIDALITETQHSINLLKEHRATLISAAVTGKIDIRELYRSNAPALECV